MNHLKHIEKAHTHNSDDKYDIHIITISNKVKEFEDGLWINLDDDLNVLKWAQNYSSDLNDYHYLIYGLMTLSQKLGNKYLLSLEIREVENFLRESNDKVAIANLTKYLPFFEDLIHNVVKGLSYSAFLSSGLSLIDYSDLGYKDKLEFFNELATKISTVSSTLFDEKVEVKFIALEEDKITYEFSGIDVNLKHFKSYLEGIHQYLCLTLSSEDIILLAQ